MILTLHTFLIFTTGTLSLRCLDVVWGRTFPCLFVAELVLGKYGGALLPLGLVAFARGSGGIGIMNRFVVALVVGLGLRGDVSLEESSTVKALFFLLGLFRLGLFRLGLGLDIVPTDDSSLEESPAGACIATPPVAMVLAVAIASLDQFVVAVVVVVGGANFVVAAHADKEGNANVGDVVPTSQVVARGTMAAVVAVGGTASAVDNDVDVVIVVVDNGDAIAVAVAAHIHAVRVALAVAVCGSTGDSTWDSKMVALQRTGRGGPGRSSSSCSCSVSVAEEEASLFRFGFVLQAAKTLLSSSSIVLQQAS
jgi:hypothetical protein